MRVAVKALKILGVTAGAALVALSGYIGYLNIKDYRQQKRFLASRRP